MRDPEGIVSHAMKVKLTFRSDYYAQLFVKRMCEAWGLVKPAPTPEHVPTPKPSGESLSDSAATGWTIAIILVFVAYFILVVVTLLW